MLMLAMIERHLTGRRETIVDLGCHSGFFLRLSASLEFKRFIGVDFFQLPADRSFLTELPGAEFLKANLNTDRFLQLEDGGADCVVATEVFEHLYHHPVAFLQECMRVLRPGGLLLLTTPNPATLANAVRLLRNRSTSWGAVDFAKTSKITASGEPLAVWDIHYFEYNADELHQILRHVEKAEVVDSGFVASAHAPHDGLAKKLAKTAQWKLGLGGSRAFSTTQYAVVRKQVD